MLQRCIHRRSCISKVSVSSCSVALAIPIRTSTTTQMQCDISTAIRKTSHTSLKHKQLNPYNVSYRHMSSSIGDADVLILADHNNKKLGESTLHVVEAAKKLSPKSISILVAGADCKAVADRAARINGVTRVIVADNPAYKYGIAENVSKLIAEYHKKDGFSYLLTAGSASGKNIIPRVSALLDVQPLSDVAEIVDSSTFVRPIYAGNVLATFQSSDKVKAMTIRTTNFEKAELGDKPVEVSDFKIDDADAKLSEWVAEELSVSERPELGSAKVVVSGGRGLKNGENFNMLYELADLLGGAVGASRAAVDAGYVPNDMQVGQTGKVVAPDLYIAAGISGAIQHLAGMKDSKVIVAINKDAEAPIFSVADYGLVADLFKAVPELTQKIKADKQ